MNTNYVLIDYENVQVKSLALLKDEHFQVRVFLGPKNAKLPVEFVLAIQELGERAEYIVLETPGSNALDFHLTYYLGALAAADPTGCFHIISKDTGFDSLIQHLKTKNVFSVRSISIEEMPCFSKFTAGAVRSKHVSGEEGRTSGQARPTIDEMVKIAVDDLIKRKAARPRSPTTLRSTIHAKCGRGVPAADVDAVYEALVKRGYVMINGAKVTYALPGANL